MTFKAELRQPAERTAETRAQMICEYTGLGAKIERGDLCPNLIKHFRDSGVGYSASEDGESC